MPLAAFATLDGNTLTLDAAWGDPDGVLELVCAHASAPVPDLASAAALGTLVAANLRAGVLARGGSIPVPDATQGAA
jgi:hydroxymethylbilane synthase